MASAAQWLLKPMDLLDLEYWKCYPESKDSSMSFLSDKLHVVVQGSGYSK